jgi:hypothetical protein
MPAIHICIRRTADWSDEQAFWEQLAPKHRARVEFFNRTFKLAFHEFRRRLCEIRRLNHEQVEGAAHTAWDQVPAGELVMPVDDDDWFAPDAALVLSRELRAEAAGYRWTPTWLEAPLNRRHAIAKIAGRFLPGLPRARFFCTTNNYAVVKDRVPEQVVRYHVDASSWFEPRVGSEVVVLEPRLSLANRSIGSLTSLGTSQATISRRALLAKHRQYRRLYKRPPPAGLDWARPYLERMDRLMSELEPR